jgi:subtilisin family serine protease
MKRGIRKLPMWVLFVALVVGFVQPLAGQTGPSDALALSAIEIDALAPFEVSFQVQNAGDNTLQEVSGKAVLEDQSGSSIEAVSIDAFSVAPYATSRISAASRWEFQKPGIYLLQISLDAGPDGLVSRSLAFRILPIILPLAAPAHLAGEGLSTVYQQPADWGISMIDAPKAWQTTHGSDDVVVAVIDSGIDTGIPELARSMWTNEGEIPDNGIDDDGNGYVDDVHGWDFRDNDNSSLVGTKLHWHGTFVASIIAAWPDENGIVGVAPGVKLMDVRFLDSHNLFYGSDWRKFADAVEYAVDNGADIINLSVYANNKPPSYFKQAILNATEHGVIVVGIAGNDGASQVRYPARYPNVVAVSAIDEKNRLASFSDYGREVELTAPGDKITALFPGGIAGTSSGTSFAAPHVSGVLALILSAYPQLTSDQALDLLETNAVDLGAVGRDNHFGYGLINAGAVMPR